MVDDLRRRLVNRLEVEAWYADHPEIDELPVLGPVDINGLPRTGTTALANMLSLDPQFRSLRQWEQVQPCPPPTTAGEATDPRRLQLERENEQVSPELKAMHLYDVDATVEDTWLLGMAFHGQQYTVPVYGYHAWWRTADMTTDLRVPPSRREAARSRERPPHLWLFKAPHHNFHLEAILAAYPDARFVMTHRDPVKAVPSWASLVSTIFPDSADATRPAPARSRGVEPPARRRRAGHRGACAHRRGPVPRRAPPRVRRRSDGHRATRLRLPRLRAHADRSSRPSATGRSRTGPARTGTHHYTAEQFGLTDAQLRDDYRFYTDHFDVDTEGTS